MGTPNTADSPTWSLKAVAGFLLGGLALGAGLVAAGQNEPALAVVILASILLSLLLGILARGEVRRSNGLLRGSDLAAWGIAMAVGTMFLQFLPTTSNCGVGMRVAQARNNLKQIGLALRAYHQDHGRFPPSAVYSPEGRPLYSWRVLILPYLEQKELYDEFDRNAAWDSPQNLKLLPRRPPVYDPVGIIADPTMTFSQVFVGDGAAFEGRQGTRLDDFPDGPERTLLVVEAGEPVPWTKPIDLPCMVIAQLLSLGGIFKGQSRAFGAGDVDGCNVVFADATIRFIPRGKLAEPALRALVTRNGSESIDDSEF